MDSSGYAFILYITSSPTHPTHLVKIGPSNSTAFDVDPYAAAVETPTHACAALLTPTITGSRYVYTIATTPPGSFQISLCSTATGAVVNTFTSGVANSENFLGAFVSSDGHLHIAAEEYDTTNAVGLQFVDYNGFTNAESEIFDPTLDPQSATYDASSGSWFITGIDPNDVNGVNAFWGSYNVGTENENFGGFKFGSYDSSSGAATRYRFNVDLLPGNNFALTTNVGTISPPALEAWSYSLRLASRSNVQAWQYPPSGTSTSGRLLQVIASNTTDPIYAEGLNDSGPSGFPLQNLQSFDWSGNQLSTASEQPVGALVATSDGFWDLFDWDASFSTFLEHYVTGFGFTWGKSYAQSNPGGLIEAGFFKEYSNALQNAFYSVSCTNSGLSIDRFVLGTALASLTVPNSFSEGATFQVTINMNRTVQSGETRTVSLYSSNANVTMPNGMRSQLFTVPAGQQTLAVTLNTSNVGSPYGVVLTANQNGVYRYGASNGS